MLDLVPSGSHYRTFKGKEQWTPTDVMQAPEPPSAEEKLAEQQRIEQQAMQAQEAGGRIMRNRNKARRTVDYFPGLERQRIVPFSLHF